MSTDPAERGGEDRETWRADWQPLTAQGETEDGGPVDAAEHLIADCGAPWPRYEPLTLESPTRTAESAAVDPEPPTLGRPQSIFAKLKDSNFRRRTDSKARLLAEFKRKVQTESLRRPYVVSFAGPQLLVTPPRPPGLRAKVSPIGSALIALCAGMSTLFFENRMAILIGLLFLASSYSCFSLQWRIVDRTCWAFSTGIGHTIQQGDSTVLRFFYRIATRLLGRKTEYCIARVEIRHDIWRSGNGSTDYLRICGPGYAPRNVAAIEYVTNVGYQREERLPNWLVSKLLVGPAVTHGLPKGIGEAYDSADLAAVSPTIVSLSRLVSETTRRPMFVVIGSRKEPDYSDANDGG